MAYTIAKETFQNKLKIKKIKNYYFDKAKKYFKLKKKHQIIIRKITFYIYVNQLMIIIKKIFFIMKRLFEFIFKKLNNFKNINRITFRPHPYEKNSKYNWLLSKKNFKIKIEKKNFISRNIKK